MYGVNVVPISPKIGIQLLDFLSKLGEFYCTKSMVNVIAKNVIAGIPSLPNFEKVDLAIALMVIPITTALELARQCLSNISQVECKSIVCDIDIKTDFFSKIQKQRKRIYR